MDLNLLVVLAYLVVVLGLGLSMWRYARSDEGFLVGGRALGQWGVGGSVLATHVAALWLIPLAGVAYAEGGASALAAVWLGNVGAALGAVLVVPRMRRLRMGAVGELLGTRYNRAVQLLPALYWVALYAAAAGSAVYLVSDVVGRALVLDFWIVLAAVGLVVVVTCAAGGYLGAAYAGVFQSFVLVLGGGVLLASVVKASGGVVAFARMTPDEWFVLWRSEGAWPTWRWAVLCGVLALPYWCASPHLVHRALGARSVRDASRGLVVGAFVASGLAVCFVLAALCGRLLYQGEVGPASPELILPSLCRDWVPGGLGGLSLAALVAAAQGVAGALVCAAAAVVVNDVYRPSRPDRPGAHYAVVGRAAAAAVGLAALGYAAALRSVGEPLRVGFAVLTFLEPALFVVVLGAVVGRLATSPGALACLVCGAAYNALGLFVLGHGDATRALVQVPLCGGVLVVASLVTARRSREEAGELAQYAEFLRSGGVAWGDWRLWLGLSVAGASALAFAAASTGEQRLPQPHSLVVFFGLVMTFLAGVYILLPAVIGREMAEEGDRRGGVERSIAARVLGSGGVWLVFYVLAGALALLVYLMVY
ncbi:MAG: sodium:solute symporter family transporter [Candidatus Brocadiia bacterium]